jgi:SAM-dependent methyltransferase
MITRCPVCDAAETRSIDRRPRVPVLLNRVYGSSEEARSARSGVLDMWACDQCGFAWNAAFDPSLITYDEDYENDQTHSAVFLKHMKSRAAAVVKAVPASESIDFLEIGCGQGRFVAEVALAAGERRRTAEGFDPAWRGRDGDGPNGSRIHKCYFNAETSNRLRHQPNVVAARHTIEHVPDPISFLRSIRAALGPTSRANIFIETPCIEWILSHEAMQDLFYEHCSIFAPGSLRFALEKCGFRALNIEHVFRGQYLWAHAQAAETTDVRAPTGAGLGDLAGARVRFTARWGRAVEEARASGPVAIWGAGAKGVTFALLIDPEARLIDHAIDINREKQGLHLAGSGLQILSPLFSAARAPKTIFIMNPNYIDEIRQIAAAAGINARLIPIG